MTKEHAFRNLMHVATRLSIIHFELETCYYFWQKGGNEDCFLGKYFVDLTVDLVIVFSLANLNYELKMITYLAKSTILQLEEQNCAKRPKRTAQHRKILQMRDG